MNFVQYFADHYIMLTELIGLWALLGMGVHISKKTTETTKVAILLIIIESLAWSFEAWTQENSPYITLRAILTACVYCLHPLIAVAIIDMMAPVKKHKILLFLPLFIYIPLVFTSQWTHVIYYISDANHWVGANNIMAYLPYIMFICYAVVFLVLFVIRYRSNSLRTAMAAIYIFIVGLAGLFINLYREASIDYATLFSSIIVLYYLFMYMQISRTDHMTGVMDRNAFYHDAGENRNLSAVCSIDMNELKKINDTLGHEAGDKALRTIAECLLRSPDKSRHVYRIGGDEFAILYFGKNELEVQSDIAALRAALSRTDYSCAFGYSMIDGDGFEEALRKADKAMYDNKAEMKAGV